MRSITLLGHAYLATHWPAKDSGNHQDCNEFSIGAEITTVLMPPPWFYFLAHGKKDLFYRSLEDYYDRGTEYQGWIIPYYS